MAAPTVVLVVFSMPQPRHAPIVWQASAAREAAPSQDVVSTHALLLFPFQSSLQASGSQIESKDYCVLSVACVQRSREAVQQECVPPSRESVYIFCKELLRCIDSQMALMRQWNLSELYAYLLAPVNSVCHFASLTPYRHDLMTSRSHDPIILL